MGNTEYLPAFASLLRDHPHIHGEYMPEIIRPDAGKRITPTYMGNTKIRHFQCDEWQDHPHIHGEYTIKGQQYFINKGSPPHTWGILTSHKTPLQVPWITPTYMGNTPTAPPPPPGLGDHPHIHGEYQKCRQTIGFVSGSPPHTWGIRTRHELFVTWP